MELIYESSLEDRWSLEEGVPSFSSVPIYKMMTSSTWTTLTLTAESTTAALAWERRGVTRSQILRERERERERVIT